jgi:hypothetical protein
MSKSATPPQLEIRTQHFCSGPTPTCLLVFRSLQSQRNTLYRAIGRLLVSAVVLAEFRLARQLKRFKIEESGKQTNPEATNVPLSPNRLD